MRPQLDGLAQTIKRSNAAFDQMACFSGLIGTWRLGEELAAFNAEDAGKTAPRSRASEAKLRRVVVRARDIAARIRDSFNAVDWGPDPSSWIEDMEDEVRRSKEPPNIEIGWRGDFRPDR